MNNKIIVIEQLPVITERLQTIKADVTKRTDMAMSLVCTEDTVKAVKKIRAELNTEFKEWEEKRKEVKTAIMKPYNDFDAVYKDCITDVFKQADADLKEKIDSVENELKQRKAREVLDYFNEYICSVEAVTGIPLFDFVTFERSNINVTLSSSLKSLKEQAKAYIDRICDDLNLIGLQEHKDEIFHEYKQSLNASAAVTTVVNRHKAIEEARKREEERKARAEAAKKAAEKVENVVETLAPPVEVTKQVEPKVTVKLEIRATRTQLKALKEFLNNGGYEYK